MKTAKGKISDVLLIRLQRGDDMVEGIRKACMENGVKSGVIMSMVGSIDGAHYNCPYNDADGIGGITQGAQFLESPAALLSAGGEICHYEDGKLDIHIHAVFVDTKGIAHGGHIKGAGNKVLNTLNIFIGVIEKADMCFEWDDELGENQFCPKQI